MPRQVTFALRDERGGGYSVRAVRHPVFTQGDTWDELLDSISKAVVCHFGKTGLVFHYRRRDRRTIVISEIDADAVAHLMKGRMSG